MLNRFLISALLAWVGANFVWWRRSRNQWESAAYVRCNSCDHIAEFSRPVRRLERAPLLWSEVALALMLCWAWVFAFRRLFWVFPIVQLAVWSTRRRVTGACCALCGTHDVRTATREEYERVMTMSPHR